MSVYLIDNESFYGYRVRRVINGAPYQQYFSLLDKGKRLRGVAKKSIESTAKKLDDQLAKKQVKAWSIREKELRPSKRAKNSSGVKGISICVKTTRRTSRRYDYLVFQVNCMSKLEDKPVCTSFSVDAHGWESAWEKAVRYYTKHKKLPRLANTLLERMPNKAATLRRLKLSKASKKKS
jgi:hypothetical protein